MSEASSDLTPFLPSCQEGGRNSYLRDTPSAKLRASSQTPPIRPDESGLSRFYRDRTGNPDSSGLHSPFFSSLLGELELAGRCDQAEHLADPLLRLVAPLVAAEVHVSASGYVIDQGGASFL